MLIRTGTVQPRDDDKENFPELSRWRLEILATDICSSVLLKAERGRYSQLEINRGLPAVLLSRYFTRQGIEWEIVKDIRDKVEFRSLNLADSWPTMPAMDIILLRNVLIYFDVEKKEADFGEGASPVMSGWIHVNGWSGNDAEPG